MGVRGQLAARAVRGTRALLVECPGWWVVRAGVEREVRRRGWFLATSPADADALVVCGVPGQRLRAAVEAVWEQVPGPRAREDVTGADPLAALDRVEAALLDLDGQRADAGRRRQQRAPTRDAFDDGADDGQHGEGDGMGMAPDGIELAGGFEGDRDDLEMDVLHVRLGPVLPAWPAGIVVRATLSGDVLVEAEVEVLDESLPREEGPARSTPAVRAASPVLAARGCDRAGALLALAGADDLAAGLRRVRDDLLAGTGPERALRVLEQLARRVERSGLLRWSLRGLGHLDAAAVERYDLPASCGGDVHDRLVAMLEAAVDALRGLDDLEGGDADARLPEREDVDVAQHALAAVPALVVGYELGAARLVVASLPLAVGGLALADAP